MKIALISRAVALSLLSLTALLKCTERKGGPGSRNSGKDTIVNTISAAQIARWVDYVNYEVSRHALLKDDTKLQKFDEATASDKSYDAVTEVLAKLKGNKDSLSKNEILAKEINTLKIAALSYKKTADLTAFLSDSIFKDAVKYKNIHQFYQIRIKTGDSIKLMELQATLKKAIEDSIKKSLGKNKIKDSASVQIPKAGQDSDRKDDDSSLVPIVLICATLLIIALAVLSWLKKRRKPNPAGTAASGTGDKNTTGSEPKVQPAEDSHKTENEKLWRKVREQEQTIAKLERELEQYKNKPLQEKATQPANTNSILYFPAPNNSCFPASAGSSSKRSVDAYQLEVNGDKALFNLIAEDGEVVKRSLVTPNIYILPVCEIDGDSGLFSTATSVKVLEKGELKKEGDQWVLKKKSLIKLL
jgi:hypothetical protein